MLTRAILVQRFWRFLKVGRQRIDINCSFVRHGTVNLRRMSDVNYAHGEIQNEHRRCSFHIVLEAAPRKPGKRMLANGHSPSWQRCIATASTKMFNSDHAVGKCSILFCKGIVLQHLSLSQLPCGKWLATHGRVDGSKTLRLLIFATPPTVIGSPRYRTLLSAVVNAGHAGRPGPFGSPDLAKLTQ